MEVQPAVFFLVIDEVGTVALPEGKTTHLMVGIQSEHQHAGSQEGGPDGLAVVGCLDDVRGQGVHGDLTDGPGIKPGDLIVLLDDVDIASEAIGVVVDHVVVPDFFKSAHDAEEMAPGSLVGGVPELAPLLLAVGGGVEIGVPGVEIFRCLDAFGVVDTLGECQMFFHLPNSFL